jgi:cytochrome c oxidase subunit 3
MAIFLVSLSILFAASLVAVVLVRARAPQWIPAGAAPLPWGLWASTVVLLGSGASMQGAVAAIRRGKQPVSARLLVATLILGVTFLVLQGLNWRRMLVEDALLATESLYAWSFYVLTALHALHVVGGLVPLAITTRRAARGAYSWADFQGVRLVAMYWHFLHAVWIVLFAVLLLAR